MASRHSGVDGQPRHDDVVARRTLRSRILLTILAITGTAVIGFGVPAGVALGRVEHDRLVLTLEREASEVLAVVPDSALVAGGQLRLPTPILGARDRDDASIVVGAYGASGDRLSGAGPLHSGAAAAAIASHRETVTTESGQLVVSLPLLSDRPSAAAVRVAESLGDINQDTRVAWLLMTALGAGILMLAGVASFLLARRLTRPLDSLAQGARLLGQGDFTVRTTRAGLREIDAVGESLDVTAQRLGDLLERERAFSSNASHQIRTPLAAVRLNLETLPQEPGPESARVIRETIGQLDRLESTVNQLLELSRDVEMPGRLSVFELLNDLTGRWAPAARRAGRPLRVIQDSGLPEVRGSVASLAHVLDVLVDNALQHGTGEVVVRARLAGRGIAIDVRDKGAGVMGDPGEVFERRSASARGHGIGLALARSLVEAEGGRLELTTPGPEPVFSVVLPAQRQDASDEATGTPTTAETS